jgi:hypothetical protein
MVGDAGAGPLPGDEPAFGDELPVRLGDGVAGQAKVDSELPGRRQPGGWAEPSGAYGLPQRVL